MTLHDGDDVSDGGTGLSHSGGDDDDDGECNAGSSDNDVNDPSCFEADLKKLQTYFKNALQSWTNGRLVIFLDSVDQLDDSFGALRLNWLHTNTQSCSRGNASYFHTLR